MNMRLMARQNIFSLLIPLRDEANLMSVSITFRTNKCKVFVVFVTKCVLLLMLINTLAH